MEWACVLMMSAGIQGERVVLSARLFLSIKARVLETKIQMLSASLSLTHSHALKLSHSIQRISSNLTDNFR